MDDLFSKDDIMGRLVEVYLQAENLLKDHEANSGYRHKHTHIYNHGVLASMKRVLSVVRDYLTVFDIVTVRNGLYMQSLRKREDPSIRAIVDMDIGQVDVISNIDDIDRLDTVIELIGLEFMIEMMDDCMAGEEYDGQSELFLF